MVAELDRRFTFSDLDLQGKTCKAGMDRQRETKVRLECVCGACKPDWGAFGREDLLRDFQGD